MSRRFVILDRDGTINEETGYVFSPGEVRLLPGAAEAIGELRELGLGVVVVTNQLPVGQTGCITMAQLDAINDRVRELLRESGTDVDAIGFCRTAPTTCASAASRERAWWTAPRPPSASSPRPRSSSATTDDMRLGRAVGARTILVLTGHGGQERAAARGAADHVVADLRPAAAVIRDEVLAGAGR